MELREFWHAPHEMVRELVLNRIVSPPALTLHAIAGIKKMVIGASISIGALGYQVIDVCQTEPLKFLLGLGLDIPRLLEEEQPARARPNPNSDWGFSPPMKKARGRPPKRTEPKPPAVVLVIDNDLGDTASNPISLD